jgi:hypothetical protein
MYKKCCPTCTYIHTYVFTYIHKHMCIHTQPADAQHMKCVYLIFLHTHNCVYIHTSVYTYTQSMAKLNGHDMRNHVGIHLHVCVYTHTMHGASLKRHMCVYIYICVCIYTCACVYTLHGATPELRKFQSTVHNSFFSCLRVRAHVTRKHEMHVHDLETFTRMRPSIHGESSMCIPVEQNKTSYIKKKQSTTTSYMKKHASITSVRFLVLSGHGAS